MRRFFSCLFLTIILIAHTSASAAGFTLGYCIDDDNLNRVIAGFNRDWILGVERRAKEAGFETYRISEYETSVATEKLTPEELLKWVNKTLEIWGGSANERSFPDRALVQILSPTGYPVGCVKGDYGQRPSFLP